MKNRKEETMTKLVLEYEQSKDVIRTSDPNDSWDRDDTTTHFHPTVMRLGERGRSWIGETFDVPFDVKVGDPVLLVVVRYDTGDTFGRSENQFLFIGVYKEGEELEKVLKSIKDNSHERSYCWTGCFENYRDTEVHRMVVQEEID